MEVLEVLEACKAEVENTHWCKGHYEDTVEWLGTPEEFLEGLPKLWRREIGAGDVEHLYKVKHCLVGMVNTYVGIDVNVDSVNDVDLPAWRGTINRLGIAIYGDNWNSDRHGALDADEYNPDDDDSTSVDHTIESWNDSQATTREDVLRVIEEAIAAEKGGS